MPVRPPRCSLAPSRRVPPVRRLWIVAALVVGTLGLLAVTVLPAAAEVFNPKTFTLDNGLQVVVVENHRAPVAIQMVWYKVGAADEPSGKSGIADRKSTRLNSSH